MAEPLSLDRLRREGEEFMIELSREFYEAYSGLKGEAQIQPLYEKHRAIFSHDSLAVAREALLASEEGSEERRSARLLLDWQEEPETSRQLAPLAERHIARERPASGRPPDRR